MTSSRQPFSVCTLATDTYARRKDEKLVQQRMDNSIHYAVVYTGMKVPKYYMIIVNLGSSIIRPYYREIYYCYTTLIYRVRETPAVSVRIPISLLFHISYIHPVYQYPLYGNQSRFPLQPFGLK